MAAAAVTLYLAKSHQRNNLLLRHSELTDLCPTFNHCAMLAVPVRQQTVESPVPN